MRATFFSSLVLLAVTLSWLACSRPSQDPGFSAPAEAGGPPPIAPPPAAASARDDTGGAPPEDAAFGPQVLDASLPEASVVTTTTTIYAHTDTALYSVDPRSFALAPLGVFAGLPDAAYQAVTDLAVNAAGVVFVNTESVVYEATLPAAPGEDAVVLLTPVARIAAPPGTYFYALAFAPAGALGPGEVLVGGDATGELWSIDPDSGVTQDLGSFGPDPQNPGRTFGLSGDVVFYTDANGQPTGLATIRSCIATSGESSCYPASAPYDFLAGIDVAALRAAYTSGTRAASLLKGVYGAGASGPGSGTGFQKIFGLGAWQGTVLGFARAVASETRPEPPRMVLIDTATGVGTMLPASLSFTDGWSGAGVTTDVTIDIPTPPPVPQ
jgi:hypothetical protein